MLERARRRIYLTVKFTIMLACLAACGSSAEVPTASCQRCGVSEEFCSAAGKAAGCKTSSFSPSSGSQCSGCSFTDCDEPPGCAEFEIERDAGSKDAGVDPTCKTADADGDGMFSRTPPCANPGTVKINGVTNYTCPCGACPCGYECGSIKLSVGGTLSSVCAPPSR